MNQKILEAGFTVSARAVRALNELDRMPPSLRQCVHEFGSEIVNEIMQSGIKDPQKIRNIVKTCWMGPRNDLNRSGRKMRGTSAVLNTLDALLIQSGSSISAPTLLRVLWDNGMVIVTREPGTLTVEASMKAIEGMSALSKREKHLIRLRAAIHATARCLWPHLFDPSVK